MPKFSNVVALLGAIVAICAMTAAVVIALCVASGPTDHTPVATSVLATFAATLAALVGILKSWANGQQQTQTQNQLRQNSDMTAAVAGRVGVPRNVTEEISNGNESVQPGG